MKTLSISMRFLVEDEDKDHFRFDYRLLHLCIKHQHVGHGIVHLVGAPLGMTGDGGKGLLYDEDGASRTGGLV